MDQPTGPNDKIMKDDNKTPAVTPEVKASETAESKKDEAGISEQTTGAPTGPTLVTSSPDASNEEKPAATDEAKDGKEDNPAEPTLGGVSDISKATTSSSDSTPKDSPEDSTTAAPETANPAVSPAFPPMPGASSGMSVAGSSVSESASAQTSTAIPAVPDAEKMATDQGMAGEHKGSSKVVIVGVVIFVLALIGVIVYLGNQMKLGQKRQAAVVQQQPVVTPMATPTPQTTNTNQVADPTNDLNSLNQDLNHL